MVFNKFIKETYPVKGDILTVKSIYELSHSNIISHSNIKLRSKIVVREDFADDLLSNYIGFTPIDILYSNETLIWINIESNIFTYAKKTLLLERLKVLSPGDEPWTNWINE